MANDDLEELWAALLSQEPARIRRAWGDLTDEEAAAVVQHLTAMRDGDGWSTQQREAATVALQVLRDQAT